MNQLIARLNDVLFVDSNKSVYKNKLKSLNRIHSSNDTQFSGVCVYSTRITVTPNEKMRNFHTRRITSD